MVRFVFILLLGLSLSSPAFAMESLKSHALLSDDVIRLGDLFTGLKSNEDRVLGRGPKPGHHMTLNARTLLRVSKAMDLDWRPISEADRITVTRAATVIDTNAIDQIVTAALEKVGVEGDIRLKYNQPSPELILPPPWARARKSRCGIMTRIQVGFRQISPRPPVTTQLRKSSLAAKLNI